MNASNIDCGVRIAGVSVHFIVVQVLFFAPIRSQRFLGGPVGSDGLVTEPGTVHFIYRSLSILRGQMTQ